MSDRNIHRIHPHVMGGHHNHDDQSDDDDFSDIFKDLGRHGQGDHNNNVHSFSATYSNVNGHVKRHFSHNGKSVDAKDAMAKMKQMDDAFDKSFKQMNQAFGGLGGLGDSDLGIDDDSRSRHRHPLRHLLGRRGNLTHRIKRHRR